LVGLIRSPNTALPYGAKWNVYEMLRHCALWEEMLLGRKHYPQSFIGRLFGKIALKSMLKDEPIKRNLPGLPAFTVKGTGDIAAAKAEWIALINAHDQQADSGFIHPFFGKVTAEQAGCMAYKHSDHHLKQFNS
jgi:hypothetical protein